MNKIYNVHGGHSLICRGASGLLDEVNEDRKVKNKVIELLRECGNTVYDCTDDSGNTQNKNLSNIKNKCNAHKVDLDISIHLNSGRNDYSGDGNTGGVEVWNYDERTKSISDAICSSISKELGITNRGTKYTKNLYILNNTKNLALLIECAFVDDKDDANKWNADKCAIAIASAIVGHAIVNSSPSKPIVPPSSKPIVPSSIDVVYQAYTSRNGWLPEVVNCNDANGNGYAGIFGRPILGLRAKTKGSPNSSGYLEYRVHKKGGNWFPWRRDYEKDSSGDTFAGTLRSEIDGIQFRIIGVSGKHVRYSVHTHGHGWLSYVTDYGEGPNGYAGIFGRAIDGIKIKIV